MRGRSPRPLKIVEFLVLLLLFQSLFIIVVGGLLSFPLTILLKYFRPFPGRITWGILALLGPGEDPYILYAGLISSIFFLPLNISVLYHMIREWKERENVSLAFDLALREYPLFFLYINTLFALSLLVPILVPALVLYAYFKKSGRVDVGSVASVAALTLYGWYLGTLGPEAVVLRRAMYVTGMLLLPLLLFPLVPVSIIKTRGKEIDNR